MTIERLPFKHRPRNSIANNLDKINELVDWTNLDTHLYASATGERVTVGDASSLKGLTVNGRSVQDGTPTPDAPVAVQVVGGLPMPSNIAWRQGSVSTTTGNEGSDENRIHTVMFKIVPGATYTVGVTNPNYLYSVRLFKGTRWITSDFVYGDSTWKSNDDTYANPNARYMSIVIRLSNNENLSPSDGDNAGVFATTSCIGLVVGDTATSIDLQGNKLASLPDNTRDELHVDSAGRVWIEKRIGAVTFDGDESWSKANTAPYNTYIRSTTANSGFSDIEIAESQYNPKNIVLLCDRFEFKGRYSANKDQYGLTISGTATATDFCFDWRNIAESMTTDEWKALLAEHPVTVYYPLAIPQTIDLGYITPPAIPSGSVVTVSASLTPTFHLEWWVDDGITALVNDLIAYVDYKTEG